MTLSIFSLPSTTVGIRCSSTGDEQRARPLSHRIKCGLHMSLGDEQQIRSPSTKALSVSSIVMEVNFNAVRDGCRYNLHNHVWQQSRFKVFCTFKTLIFRNEWDKSVIDVCGFRIWSVSVTSSPTICPTILVVCQGFCRSTSALNGMNSPLILFTAIPFKKFVDLVTKRKATAFVCWFNGKSYTLM